MFVNLSAGSRTGEAEFRSSAFPRYTAATGSYYISRELAGRASVDVYGHRGLVYSLYGGNAYFLETRNGAGMMIPLGRRIIARAFGEAGTNAYPIAVESLKRLDDASTWGGGLTVRIYRNVGITTVASNTRYSSNIAALSRSILRVYTAISLQRDFAR